MLRTTSILAVMALVVLGLTGCGSATNHTTTTTATTVALSAKGRTAATTATTVTTRKSKKVATGPLAFAECMRADGVTNFPDPSPGGGYAYKTNSNIVSSPTFQAAQAKCQHLVGGGPEGFQTNPSKQTMAKLLRIATCMRAHGIHQFPDPLYTRPRRFTPGEYQEITDFDGATLLFPADMDLQAPAYRQALKACGAPPLGLPH